MDNDEALTILEHELARFRTESYEDLVSRPPIESLHVDREGPSGATYQVEIQFFWEHHPNGNILVMGSIDDGGWRAFSPLTRSFIKAPDGSFVGE